MGNGKNMFVFVVCGARAHIDTLHYSLAALKRFTNNEIWVVTDETRNEIPVAHSHILNINTPKYFDNHQASIYLKTGLHKFLPKGNSYCYLDTDVIALSNEVDSIFNQKQRPITFAADHCSLSQFSPHAVYCNCIEEHEKDRIEIAALLEKAGHHPPVIAPALLSKQRQLQQKLELVKRNKTRLLITGLHYLLSPGVFKLDEENFYHKRQCYWADIAGQPLLYETPDAVINQVEKQSAWLWDRLKRRWISPQGKDIEWLACEHLHDAIYDKFNIDFNERWQHWNGGVFLFDDSSQPFMEAWHQNTLAIFKDPYWKTRDQGSLVATVWQLGLQNQPVLSKKFNFIAYFYNPALMLSTDKTSISSDAFASQYQPAFIHVFNHFGANGWDVWDWIENKLKK